METLASVKTEQNIEIVQKAYADFANGNISGVVDACTDDVVWASYDNPAIPYATSYQGKKGVTEFFGSVAASIDYKDFQPREFFAVADKVFVKGYHKATVKSTGKSFGHDFLMEFQLRNGKVSSFFAYVDTRDQATAFSN
jgi:uncharacterized protein